LGGATKGSGTPHALLDASDQEGAVIFCAKLDTKILKDWEKESKSGFPERNSDREKSTKNMAANVPEYAMFASGIICPKGDRWQIWV